MEDIFKYEIVQRIYDIVSEFNVKSYLVGGAVRDIIIGFCPVDFDFTAEVDEKTHRLISESIAADLNCRFDYNNYYHTSKFKYNNCEIDFVMARCEKYDGIASKPVIRKSDILDDLERRDFTVNTIAVDLSSKEMLDFHSGYKDILDRKIRVLHDNSFMDDPTRIFRGIKYASRLGFKFDDKTFYLAKDAVDKGYINCLKKGRIASEINDLIKDKNPSDMLFYMEKLGIFDSLAGLHVIINRNIDENFEKLDMTSKYVIIFNKNNPDVLLKLYEILNLKKRFLSKSRSFLENTNAEK